MQRMIGALALAAAALIAVACTDSGSADESALQVAEAVPEMEGGSGEGSDSDYTVIEVADGATIRGVVRLAGEAPPPKVVPITEDVAACGESQRVETVRIGAGDGLAEVVASLTDIRAGVGFATAAKSAVLDQAGCRFEPHILLVAPDAPVAILNSDPITHNVHTLAFENRPINRAQPTFVPKLEVDFAVPEKVKVNCDIHDWMGAWIVVMGHPYYAITDADGSFIIPNVPAGTYILELWHEQLGSLTREVTVTGGATTELALEMSIKT